MPCNDIMDLAYTYASLHGITNSILIGKLLAGGDRWFVEPSTKLVILSVTAKHGWKSPLHISIAEMEEIVWMTANNVE